MTDLEQQLLKTETGKAEIRLRLRTNTHVDAGRWWRRTPLWLCLLDADVLVLAVARRRYVQRVPIEACSASYYCHATGELVIGPTEDLTFNRFALSPQQALQFLRAIGISTDQAPPPPAPAKATSPAKPTTNTPPPLAFTAVAESANEPVLSEAEEVRQLLESEEFCAAFTEDELAEFRKMSPAELTAMLDEVDDEEDAEA